MESIRCDEARRPKGMLERVIGELVPLKPKPDNAPEIAASIRARNAAIDPNKSSAAAQAGREDRLLQGEGRRLRERDA